jgi:dihydroorotase
MRTLLSALIVTMALLCAASPAWAQTSTQYDIILKGGTVIDPANNISGKMDVAVLDGKIALVARDIPASAVKTALDKEGAVKVLDVAGFYVTPGLLDIHSHVYYPEGWINPRDHCFNSGVTTICDAGSLGANDIKKAIDLFWEPDGKIKNVIGMPRVLFFMNIAATGMTGNSQKYQFNVPLAAARAREYPGIIVGFKSYCGGRYDGDVWAVVDAAEEAGRLTNLPVMFDFAPLPDRSYAELITQKMRPGDIHTHYTAMQFPIIMDDGKVNPAVIAAQKRGVIFDIGHGSGSMVFRNAVPSIRQGLIPNSISTDLHGRNSNTPVLNMTHVMSKCLNMGLSLEDVIRLSTVNPAKEIQHPELGALSAGSTADIAVLDLRRGSFTFTDCSPGQDLTGGGKIKGDKKLECVLTLFGGKVVHDLNGFTYRNWEDIPKTEAYWGDQRGNKVMGTSY